MKGTVGTLAIAGLAAMMAVSPPVHSQEKLKILADIPLRAALIEIGEAFRRNGGREVDFVFAPSPVILKKLADGEAADVLIAQPHHIADLMQSKRIFLLFAAQIRWWIASDQPNATAGLNDLRRLLQLTFEGVAAEA